MPSLVSNVSVLLNTLVVFDVHVFTAIVKNV